ncbi:hypothetical protein [Okeania sp.]|uniref:hypothetical protein n=1 Tax=Okeania sp. TaxID=3100323 RepID=UPI002B4ADC0C|nr:hypothetical protein [Okeania sp.]MEB3339560.1 hypothetical protein [Okeania sp.]
MSNCKNNNKIFSIEEVYNCPVCYHGEISAITLMDAFSCNFCHHIFSADMEKQSLKIADSSSPLSWKWNGKKWKADHPQAEWNWMIQLLAVGFVLLPTMLIGLSAYFFTPIPGTPLCWLPIFWTVLTFLSHLVIIINIVVDYYQFPVKLYLKALGRNLWFWISLQNYST